MKKFLPALLPALVLSAWLAPSAAYAQSCGSGDTITFDADTKEGYPFRPKGIIVQLKREQCGLIALWMSAELISAQGSNCKFGAIWTVTGTEKRPVPAGGPFSGTLLDVTHVVCR